MVCALTRCRTQTDLRYCEHSRKHPPRQSEKQELIQLAWSQRSPSLDHCDEGTAGDIAVQYRRSGKADEGFTYPHSTATPSCRKKDRSDHAATTTILKVVSQSKYRPPSPRHHTNQRTMLPCIRSKKGKVSFQTQSDVCSAFSTKGASCSGTVWFFCIAKTDCAAFCRNIASSHLIKQRSSSSRWKRAKTKRIAF